jgi:predicted RNA binding protein YcfA (HicA-like mRNA interferase family)
VDAVRRESYGARVPVKVRDAIKRIEAAGWEHARTRGSHRQYRHPDRPGVVTIAGKPSDSLHPKTWASIIRQAGLEDDQ